MGLHWGARVRFWVGTGAHGFEIHGAVVGHGSDDSNGSDEVHNDNPSRICVRLFECRPMPQRRSVPRRRARLPIRFAALPAPAPAEGAEATADQPAPRAIREEDWRDATVIDIGCGGVRMRVDGPIAALVHVMVRFTLPEYVHPSGVVPAREFELAGHVLRAEPSRRRVGSMVLAVKFESLAVEDGLAISNFVGA
jgi:hypothetical protein